MFVSHQPRAALIAVTVIIIAAGEAFAEPTTPAFTYQGQLVEDGAPADGIYDIMFTLFDDEENGNVVGTQLVSDVLVTNGLFTVLLNDLGQFGPLAFNGDARWLELMVETDVLSPRQAITAAPYALYSLSGPGGGATPWQQNGSSVYYNQGNVGIGTASPNNPLEVMGSVRADNFSVPNPNNPSATVGLNWHDDVARIRYGGSGIGNSNGFVIQGTGDSTKLRLLNDGSLGLATSEPQARLHVLTKNLSIDSSALNSDEIIVEAQDAVLGLYSEPQGDWASAIALKEVSGGLLVDTWGIARQTNPSGSELYFTYGPSDNYAANPIILALEPGGNVGIGTSNPNSNRALTIQGIDTGSASNWLQFRNAAGTDEWHMNNVSGGLNFVESGVANNRLFLQEGGNIGVGTDDPLQRLHVTGNVRADGDLLGFNGNDETIDLDSFNGTYGAPTFSMRDQNDGGGLTSMFFFTAQDSGSGGGARAFIRNSIGNTTVDIDADVNDAGRILIRDNNATEITLDANYQGSGASRIIADVIQLNGADLSERFDIKSDTPIEPGMVVSIDPTNPGKLTVATEAFDKKVAGVVSGAGGVRTGLLMGQEGTIANGEHAVALTGRVWCLVDADFGTIEAGDLLTTSGTPGHAMKVTNHESAKGAVIGKAMTGLTSGRGLVLVLVSLQ